MAQDGITCPFCKSGTVGVIDSRPKNGGKRVRRYSCDDCGKRFNTVEISEAVFNLLVDNWRERRKADE